MHTDFVYDDFHPVVEFMGFNNRTCSTALSPKFTSGPVMKDPSESMMWREWFVHVEEESKESVKSLHIEAFARPDTEGDAKCLGFVSNFYDNPRYKGTCALSEYSRALFLNATKDKSNRSNPQRWTIKQHETVDDAFELLASNKPENCLRTLAVRGCDKQPTLVEGILGDEAGEYQSAWTLIKRYELVPPPPPPPTPPPPTPPAPSTPLPPSVIAAPVISGPSSTTNGYINVVVNSIGGSDRCSVTSIVFTASGNSIGSVPITKEVPTSTPGIATEGVLLALPERGYNSIYAYGKCRGMPTVVDSISILQEAADLISVFQKSRRVEKQAALDPQQVTQRSNGLSVFNAFSTLDPDTVLFSLRYQGLNVDSFGTQDENLVCTNILQIQPGGLCSILSVLPGSVLVTGTVRYRSASDANNLVKQLESGSSSTILLDGTWASGTPTKVTTEYVTEDSPPQISGPQPPTDVSMTAYYQDCPTIGALDVSFTPPQDTQGILAYTATCYPEANLRRALLIVPLSATAVKPAYGLSSIRVSPLTPEINYLCEVQSLSVNKASTVAKSPSPFNTGCNIPGPPQNLTAVGGLQNITVSWVDGYLGTPGDNTTFTAKCIQSVLNKTASCTDQSQGISATDISSGTQVGIVTQLSDQYVPYECFVIATNRLGSTCSTAGVSSSTLGPPYKATITDTIPGDMSVDVSFENALPGNPAGQYNVRAVAGGGSCSDVAKSNVTGLPAGTTSATVLNLDLNSTYSLYVETYNEFGTVCSDPVQSTTQSFGLSFGIAVNSTRNLLVATNPFLPVLSQCQVSGTQISGCGNGASISNSVAIGFNDNFAYITNLQDATIFACDLTSWTCNATLAQLPVEHEFFGMTFSKNNTLYLTTGTDAIDSCVINGLQIGPCTSTQLVGSQNLTDFGTLGIAVNETSGIFYISSLLQGFITCDLNLENCVPVNTTYLVLGIVAAEGKLFMNALDTTVVGGFAMCDQTAQGIDLDTCVLSGNETNPIAPLSFGLAYDSGQVYFANSIFVDNLFACTVDLNTNTATACQTYK